MFLEKLIGNLQKIGTYYLINIKIMKIISLIGRPGCGKGTQAEKLVEKTNWNPIYTGKLLRKRAEKEDFIGRKMKKVMNEGGLMPTPMVFNIWMPKLLEMRKKDSTNGVIFDGNPRKLYEARMLDEVFKMFEWSEYFKPLYIDISKEEARERLLKRGRSDDNEKEIERRLEWFESEVIPVLNYYEEKEILAKIDGEQSIEKVQEDIVKVLGI